MTPVAVILLPGLNTPADGDCLTLRPLLEKIVASIPGSALYVCQYDNIQDQLNALTHFVRSAIAAGMKIVVVGHSFGGAAAMWLFNQWAEILENTPPSAINPFADLAILLDPAPNRDRFSQWFRWQTAVISEGARWSVPEETVAQARCIHQTKDSWGIPPFAIGVCGCPIRTVKGRFENFKVNLGHSAMCQDPAVHGFINGHILALSQEA